MPFQVGQRVGDYEVVAMLGAGGMGHVYRVRNIISNRTEAMKVLLPDLTAEPDLAVRFVAEIRTLASFDHPNIAQLHTAFQADNQLIMVMEYVEGYTLEQMAQNRRLPLHEVATLVAQGLSALAYAHERGVVHRDIKPANLMVTSHGIVKLMDFGIAKSNVENHAQTKPGTTMGSLYYMSPEQVRGSGVDARSDLYSMGIVLYELLAGRRPFEADTTFSILNQQLNQPPQPPIELNAGLPRAMNDLILRALAKDPNQRFQTADEFRAALKPFCNTGGEQEAYVPAPYPAPAAVPQPLTQQMAGQPRPPEMPPPAYANAPYGQTPVPVASQRSGGKGLWIATGAIAAVLALVAVGFAVPHFLHTKASTSSTPGAGADISVSATPANVPTTSTPVLDNVPPAITNPASNAPGTSASNTTGSNSGAKPQGGSAAPITRIHNQPQGGGAGYGGSPQGNNFNAAANNGNAGAGQPAGASAAELSEAEERMSQISARANTARRAVGQIRSQQEAMGLGLRGDVESAESRLDSYLRSANNELGRGNVAGANRNLDKADSELATLEKFLGH